MKKSSHAIKMLGVTLLEVLLVLAVAALIIIVSIRYYSSATASQQATTMQGMIASITAAADNLAVSSGSYQAAGVNTASITPLMPNQNLKTPWNTDVTITGATATTYTVTIPGTPPAVCPLLLPKINGTADDHYSSTTTCSTAAATSVVYTYSSTST